MLWNVQGCTPDPTHPGACPPCSLRAPAAEEVQARQGPGVGRLSGLAAQGLCS